MKPFTIFFTFLNTALLLAQADQFGVKGGINSSILNESVRNVRTGLNIGLYYKAYLGKDIYFRTELYYSGQGQFQKMVNNSRTEISLRYLNMPLLLEYGKKFSFVIGPQIGLLISGTKKETINGERMKENIRGGLNDADIGITIGANLMIQHNLKIGVRFNEGFTNINISSTLPASRNMVAQLNLEYVLSSHVVNQKK